MPQLKVNKDAFEAYLDQFEGDAQYQVSLIKRILSRMPDHVRSVFCEELYFKYAFNGPCYVASHCVFGDDVHYFPTLDSLKAFLKGRNLMVDPGIIDRITDRVVSDHERKGKPLFGYFVTKGVL